MSSLEVSASVVAPEMMSDYEQMRAKNIERNNARLRALGLISAKEEGQSNGVAWRKKKNRSYSPTTTTTSKKRQRNQKAPTRTANSRKSLRLQGKQPDGKELLDDESTENPEESLEQERDARIRECREVRLRRAVDVSEAGAAQAAKENPTATYDHCLMRVRTMTHKGLCNRVKAIERAAGKHSVIKMAIFKSCLQDEGGWEIAELASRALERLKALKPPVEDE